MQLFKKLSIGNSITLIVQGVQYKSVIQEIVDEKTFFISHVLRKGYQLHYEEDEVVEFVFYRPVGVYSFFAKFIKMSVLDNLFLLKFSTVSEIEKHQRRDYFRMPTVLNTVVTYTSHDEEELTFKTYTIDISAGGARFQSNSDIPTNTIININIYLSKIFSIEIKSKVIWTYVPESIDEKKIIGIEFIEVSEKLKQKIIRFIFEEQLKIRKRQLLFKNRE